MNLINILSICIPVIGLFSFLSGYYFAKADSTTKFSEIKKEFVAPPPPALKLKHTEENSFYRGKPIKDMNRQELIEALLILLNKPVRLVRPEFPKDRNN